MKNKGYTHGGGFFKSVFLLLRALIFALGFCAIWLGAVIISTKAGVILVVCGSAVTLLCIFANILVPLSRMK